MYAIQYGKEPFDIKIFLMLLIRKIRSLVIGSLLIGLIIGVAYYFMYVVFDFSKEYTVTSQYYVEYTQDPYLESATIYYNEETWNILVTTDAFLDTMLSADASYEKEELIAATYVDILSDVRVLTVSTTTSDPTKTDELAQSVATAFAAFAQDQDVLEEVGLLDISGPAELVIDDVRPLRALILGVFIGFFVSFTVFVFYYFMCDVVEVPESLRKRYRIPVLGCETDEELLENLRYACKDIERVGLASVGTKLDIALVASKLAIDGCELISFPSMELAPEAASALRELEAVVLVVKAGSDTMGAIDRVLSFYEQQEIKLAGFIVWDMDEVFYQKLRK